MDLGDLKLSTLSSKNMIKVIRNLLKDHIISSVSIRTAKAQKRNKGNNAILGRGTA
jgi:hypothetical protein